MTIKAQVSRIVTDPYRPIMPSAGGGLMELPPIPGSNDFSNAADEEDERQLQDKKAKKEDGIDFKGRVNPGKQPNFTTNEKGCCQEKNEVFISTNVYNRLSESHDTRKNKSQKISSTNQPSVNQQQSVSLSMDKLNPKESIASCQGKNLEESLILENIAGNNGVQLRTEELLSGQFPVPTDGPNCPATACEDGIECQNMHYVRPTDSKYRTLDEIIAYAQNIAWSVKKLLTLKGNPNIGTSTDGHVDNAGCVHSSETSRKAYRYQSEVTYPKRPDIDDNHSRRISGPPTPIPIAYGEEADNMSMLDGEGLKDPRGRLECDSSTIAISDSRPPITRAKTKVKSMFSSSRTKSFRTKISRTRTDHELRNESVTSTLSCKLDNRKGSIVEQTRKSGRTQTFDSSNLHVRKDLQAPRSQLALMQDGTPVDPPSHEDKTHRFAISRSATSPGTPGFKALQRERSNQGMVGPFIRTNTKLTLRANKAAVLRKESINRSATLFHQQPAIDTSDTSPHLERKRGTSRQPAETMPKFKPLATITEKESPINAGLKEVSEYSTTPVSSNIRLEAQVIIEPPIQQQPRKADSEIYCGTTNYMNESDDSKDLVQYHEIHQGTTQQVKVYQEIPEKSPYCDELHHFGRGLENQLFTQAAEMEDQSNFALAPYFDITNGPKKQKEMPIMQNEEESSFYTDKQVVAQTSEHGLEKPDSIQWYSIRSVTSKSSTHIRDAIQVRSSLSEVGLARNSFIDNSVSHNKKHVKYSETDVDFGTIYHMARRTTPDQKVSSYSGFGASSNFFETGGDVSKSSSTISESSVAVADTDYTGGFFGDTLQESDKKDVRESQPSASEYTYFENVEKSKPDPIACDIYTGNVFNPIANSLALLGINDNCKNKSTNNSNRLPFYSYRSRSSFTRINKKHLLNCSNNSSSLVERTRSSSRENFGPKVTQTLSPSYVDHTGTLRAIAQPVSIPLSNVIDFTKYDDIDLGNSGPFFSSSSKYEDEKHPLYEGRKNGSIKNFASANQHVQKDSESLYTPGDRNTNINNNKGREEDLDINNNYFGDFYTGEMNNQWSSSQERRENHSSTPTKPPSPKYAPGSFYEHAYEHAYEEPQRSPPRAQPPTSSFFGAFTGYGEPQARQPQYSPDYADSFSYNAVNEVRSRSAGADSYEKYRRTTSASPRRNSYESDGYFDYHSPDPREERLMESHGRPRSPPVPKIKRVGAIICRENVANKDDYAEDVNRDLMEDSWIPISYRLAAEQVKEMGGGRCSSRELLKTTEAKCDSSMMDASPFAQSQILEAMGRKNAGWNLKQNTDSLKDDISMKWRDAGEQGSRTQLQQHQKKRRSSDVAPTRTSMSSVWRPSDHIPAKAMGPRTVVNKTESRGAKENKNNSRVWSAVMWVPSTVGSYVKKLW